MHKDKFALKEEKRTFYSQQPKIDPQIVVLKTSFGLSKRLCWYKPSTEYQMAWCL